MARSISPENAPDAANGEDREAEAYTDEPEKAEEKPDTSGGSQFDKLQYLLKQSSIYSQIIGDKLTRERQARADAAAKAEKKAGKAKETIVESSSRSTRHGAKKEPVAKAEPKTKKTAAKKAAAIADVIDENDLAEMSSKPSKRQRQESNGDELQAADGPSNGLQATDVLPSASKLITGVELRDYQLAGVEWLRGLYENGLNGILADEMGLGKTLQTIAFLAHLREHDVFGPFLVVCPLSTVANWTLEFERFTPSIPVVLYHGSPQERADLRRTRMSFPRKDDEGKPYKRDPTSSSMKRGGSKGSKGGSRKSSRASTPAPVEHHDTWETFPIVVTSYELVMNDKTFLNKYPWKYLIVDESHRLKNMNCRLITELKTYKSANRLLLTGTPLHNNLAELWSLLNFILPELFDNLDSFNKWFDIDTQDQKSGVVDAFTDDQTKHILTNLHAILKPFLLRRMKADVEASLPPKKEYLLQAPLTAQQKELYDAVVNRNLRTYLIDRKQRALNGGDSAVTTPGGSEADASIDDGASTSSRKKRKTGAKNYAAVSDEDYFQAWEDNTSEVDASEDMSLESGKAAHARQAERSVNNMKLQNIVMQLRKVCNHRACILSLCLTHTAWLFDWPRDPKTGLELVNEDLIHASGKMLLLDRLLVELFKRGHKCLIFSQFSSQLDIIQDYAEEFKGWPVCRIDGHTKQDERREQIKSFNEDTGDDAPNMFLLSTRAGGVGINLTAADTVIFIDSDWNPQMDLQAQDRAHRLGQTKPVLVFRLVAGNTIEAKILQRAGAKRKLENLVLGQGAFSGGGVAEILGKKRKRETAMTAIAEELLADESESITLVSKNDQLLSDEQLDALLDRSDEAMSRELGWSTSAARKGKGKRTPAKNATFEVFETRAHDDEEGDFMSKLMKTGEDDED